MKIRIKGNSLRYRLTKTEVSTLAQQGIIEEQTEFPGSTLTYAIKATTATELSAAFEHKIITLSVPNYMLQQWANTDQVGLEQHMLLSGGGSCFLLIEKDFRCIDAGEDQSDFFENPHLTC